jgi:hypothetical protein
MASTVETIATTVKVAPVTGIAVTDKVFDSVSGNWTRDIRVTGEAPFGAVVKPLVFTLRLEAESEEALDMLTPQLNY